MVAPFPPSSSPDDQPPADPASDADPIPTRPVETRGAAGPDGGNGPGSGRMLGVILLLVLAFAAGATLDQAAWRGSAAAPVPSVGLGPTSSVGPPTTFRPTASGGSSSAPTEQPTVAPTPVVTPGPTIGPGATVPPFAPANIGLLWESMALIREHFVRRDTLNPTDETYGAVNGLVDLLGDPGHTVFLTPEQVKSEEEALSGTITGIGVFLGQVSDVPIVVSVISGSPAAKAGVLPGDRIVAINGQAAEGLSTEEIASLVRGPEGTQVTLSVIHPHTTTPVDITITRAKITVPPVSWTMIPGTTIADIRVNQFSSGTTDQFVTALRGAKQAGATSVILDLRNDPGGFVDDAVGVASQLLANGTVYIRQLADGTQIPVAVRPGGIATETPLAVMVDFGTASSAEIVAGALQDAKRGPVIGTRTYGTGTVLNTFPLSDGSAIRLGVELWLTPSGEAIFPNGIQPDQAVALPEGARALEPDTIRTMTPAEIQASGDDQLLRAMQVLGAP